MTEGICAGGYICRFNFACGSPSGIDQEGGNYREEFSIAARGVDGDFMADEVYGSLYDKKETFRAKKETLNLVI